MHGMRDCLPWLLVKESECHSDVETNQVRREMRGWIACTYLFTVLRILELLHFLQQLFVTPILEPIIM
jgi:hypothetical protein